MLKMAISLLWVAAALTMRVDDKDPLKSINIVKVLAAYSGKCTVFNKQLGEFDYASQSFVSCFREFINVYLSLPYNSDSSNGTKAQAF